MWSAAEEAGRQGGNSHFEPGGACALGPPDYRDALELHVAGERDVDDDLRVVLLARAALCVFQRRSFVSIEGLSADQRTVPAARIGCEYWSVGRHTLVRSSRSSQLRKRSLQDPGTSSFRARTCEHNDRQTSVIEPYAGVRNESKRRRVLLLVEMLPACAGIPSVLSLSLSLSLSLCFREESYLVRVNVLVEAPHRAAVLGVAVMVVRAAPVVRRHFI